MMPITQLVGHLRMMVINPLLSPFHITIVIEAINNCNMLVRQLRLTIGHVGSREWCCWLIPGDFRWTCSSQYGLRVFHAPLAHTRVFKSLILLMATGKIFFYASKHHSNTHSCMLYGAVCVLQHEVWVMRTKGRMVEVMPTL